MYALLISLGAGLAVGFGWTLLGLWGGWILGLILGLIAFAAAWIPINLRLRKQLQPAMQRFQRQVEAGMYRPAIESLEGLLPLGRWVPMLAGQLHAQIGVVGFHYAARERDVAWRAKAMQHLHQASPRASEGQLLLASILYRDGDVGGARKVLDRAIKYNKRNALLYNTYAYILMKGEDRDAAMAQLARHLKVEENNAASKENLLRLQNGRKLSMKRFGMEWYGLGFERPPAQSLQQEGFRPGFRQQRKKRR